MIKKIGGITAIFIWIFTGIFTSLLIAWLALKPFDFGYKYWYDVLGTEQVISKYAAQNRYGKQNFIYTDKIEHERLFGDIMYKVHHQGDGLDEIIYYSPHEQELGVLLRPAEVEHLQDVANILSVMFKVSYLSVAIFLIFSGWLIYKKKVPRLRKTALYLLVTMVVITIFIFILGPEKVFYQLHIWFFPVDHQWFFYYQDSLMVILMHGTTLFGMISIIWFLLTLLIYLLFCVCCYRLQFSKLLPINNRALH
jgi:uncharacterized membrane protein